MYIEPAILFLGLSVSIGIGFIAGVLADIIFRD